MATIIENPDPELKAKWGPLAHVSELDRNHILNLPFGGFKPAVKNIEEQLKEIGKKKKRQESDLKRLHKHPPMKAQ